MIFTNDKGKEYRFEQEGLNVWRSGFDNWLAGKAVERGAQMRDCTTAVFCEDKGEFVSVTLHGDKTYTEKARYVLDCEGVVGALKRKIMGRTDGYITTFQTFNRGSIELDSHYFYAYLQPELSQYDAWFNVKDELLVLGVSVKEPEKTEYYYEKFLSYMKKEHNLYIEEQTKAEKCLCPISVPAVRLITAEAGFYLLVKSQAFSIPWGKASPQEWKADTRRRKRRQCILNIRKKCLKPTVTERLPCSPICGGNGALSAGLQKPSGKWNNRKG